MKKSILFINLFLLLASCSTINNEEKELPVETTILKDTFKKLNNSSTYTIFSTSNLKGTLNEVTYEDGWFVNRSVSTIASEIYIGDNNDYSLISSLGYCVVDEGIMKYSYAENGFIIPSYLQTESKDLLSSSCLKNLPTLEEFVLPSLLKTGDTYNFNLGLKRDVKIVDQFLNTALYNYEDVKDDIKDCLVKAENEGKSLHFICQLVSNDNNSGVIDVEITNIGEDKAPESIVEYINNGGSYLPFSDELKNMKKTLDTFSPYFYEYDNENYGLLRFTIGSSYRALTFLENEGEYNQYLVKVTGVDSIIDNIYSVYEHDGKFYSYSFTGYTLIDPTNSNFKNVMYNCQIFDNTVTSDQLDEALDIAAYAYFGLFDVYSLNLSSSLAIYSETKEEVFALIDDCYTTKDEEVLSTLNNKLNLTGEDKMVCLGVNFVNDCLTICFYNASGRGNYLTFEGFNDDCDIDEVNNFLNLIRGNTK